MSVALEIAAELREAHKPYGVAPYSDREFCAECDEVAEAPWCYWPCHYIAMADTLEAEYSEQDLTSVTGVC